jgi:hypothetical protein
VTIPVDAVIISFDNPPPVQLGPANWNTIPDVRFRCQPFGKAITFPLVISHRSGSITIGDARPRATTLSNPYYMNPYYIRQRNEFGNHGTVLQFLVVKGEGWTFVSTSPTVFEQPLQGVRASMDVLTCRSPPRLP